ncbi:MAG TPA: hypothetical protein VH062_14290 [Polyangiaceae bacterium]|nr:hypothetical protein [Polyangiaceae bacterium]
MARTLVAALQLAALATVLAFRFPRGFALDDAWIHQVVARTFVETGVLGFDPSHPGSGATSLLWTLLLSINPALFHVAPPVFTILVTAGCLLGCGQLIYGLALADGLDDAEAALVAVAFAASGNVVWFAASGMEVTLVVLLTLAALHFAFSKASLRSSGSAGAVLVLLFFTRPETILFGFLLVLVRRRTWREVGALLGPVVIAAAVYATVNVSHTGHAFPVTFEGRRWLSRIGLLGATPVDVGWSLLGQWFDRLAEYTLGTPSPLVFFVALGLAFSGVHRLVTERRARLATIVAWAVVHTLVYVALLPSLGHGGRYQPFVPAVFSVGAVFGALRLGESVAARAALPARRAVAWALVLPLVFAMSRAVVAWGDANTLAVQHEDATELAVARDVAALPADAVVASFDIGAIAYFSRRPIEDLGGLVQPAIVPFLREGRAVEWLRHVKATHLVLPLGYRNDLPEPFNFGDILRVFGSSELRLQVVADHVTPLVSWLGGVRATSNSAPRQRLYRIVWQRGAP